MMSEKEYPMDENYNQALNFLMEQIAERDKLRKKIIILSPEARPEGLRLLAQLDKTIEKCEQALADEYDAHQKTCRSEEEYDKAFDELVEGLAGTYVHIKYRHPERLEKLETIIADMPPVERKQLQDRAARFEAGDLISLIAREGETLEQTEEFLKNYRAAENKKI